HAQLKRIPLEELEKEVEQKVQDIKENGLSPQEWKKIFPARNNNPSNLPEHLKAALSPLNREILPDSPSENPLPDTPLSFNSKIRDIRFNPESQQNTDNKVDRNENPSEIKPQPNVNEKDTNKWGKYLKTLRLQAGYENQKELANKLYEMTNDDTFTENMISVYETNPKRVPKRKGARLRMFLLIRALKLNLKQANKFLKLADMPEVDRNEYADHFSKRPINFKAATVTIDFPSDAIEDFEKYSDIIALTIAKFIDKPEDQVHISNIRIGSIVFELYLPESVQGNLGDYLPNEQTLEELISKIYLVLANNPSLQTDIYALEVEEKDQIINNIIEQII
ncbi:MAG: hypothetical protein AAF902_05975, partial [Chloroflexota bacterium]